MFTRIFSPVILSLLAAPLTLAEAVLVGEKCALKQGNKAAVSLSVGDKFVADQQTGLSLPIRLFNWNVQKISNTGWQQDLMSYAKHSNLLLLQEATEHVAIAKHLPQLGFHSLAPGYHDGEQQTGVLTATQMPPLSSCYHVHQEPWLRTPKAMHISWYALDGVAETLLVVNVHSVNFAWGLKDYRRQLMAIVERLKSHAGPVILSGDFNTWNKKRLDLLTRFTLEHGLSAIEFHQDHRVQVFGLHLDHVFVRGFKVKSSQTWVTESSDHNPIYAELELESTGL
ncbi:MAG: endonuclease/exonuclease/phosphatase family protein [Pseudomonadales bacterium]|nr:endonuclease/exonuclease/phosphatase family protein [Pseudomonadales bacterium]